MLSDSEKELRVMDRNPNTTTLGSHFDEDTIEAVWQKAIPDPNYSTIRLDRCGAAIQRSAYGSTGALGWEIDHIKPIAKGGTDELRNLQPLHWENNRHKSDDYPCWDCRKKT